MRDLHHARNSEWSRREWQEFKAEITKDILHRKPELATLVDRMWDAAYNYEFEIFEKGNKDAELIYAELK